MIDRTIAPAFKTIDKIDVTHTKHSKLSNGMDVYTLSEGSQEITRLEFVFKGGMVYQPATLIASSVSALLETGTKSFTANQISDDIDFLGSFLEVGVGQDYSSVTLFSLNKYLDESLKIVEEVIKYPTFPEEEFKIHLANKKQKHLINSQKVSVIARRKFSELLFGHKHPYGIDVQLTDFERVDLTEVKKFYADHYHSNNCTIIACGRLPDNLISILEKHFGKEKWGNGVEVGNINIPLETAAQRVNFFAKEDAIQSAIRIGRILFNKTNPDIFHMQVLNTLLGGYFGSRLMANIREDKGYTYGIGSGITSLVNTGYFYISTEVGADVTQKALDEIYKEIKRLREEPVSLDELETVKNYILGQFLRSVDGPFALADKFRAIWEFGLDYNYFDQYVKAVQTVTPKDVLNMANKYLQEKDLIECVVGKK
jgi:zinc protease